MAKSTSCNKKTESHKTSIAKKTMPSGIKSKKR